MFFKELPLPHKVILKKKKSWKTHKAGWEPDYKFIAIKRKTAWSSVSFGVREGENKFHVVFFLIGITVISPAGVIWRWISSLIPVIQALFFIIQTCRLNCNMPSSRMRSASKGTGATAERERWELDVLLQQTVLKRLRLLTFECY